MTDNFDAIKDFLTPKEIIVEEIDTKHSKIILEPLERGFGHTLGNALRRIILSSTPGSAVVEAKIDGVLHEYSSIDGIKEDVINILLNLKGMSVRMFDQEEVELSVEKYKSIKPINNNRIDFDCKVSRDKLIRSALNILATSPPRFPAIEKKTRILNKIPEAELLFKIL